MDIYCSISKQFRHLKDEIDSHVIDLFNLHGWSVSLRSFEGGDYDMPRTEVGKPDMLVVYIDHVNDKVGRGCAHEVKYALSANIPILMVNPDGQVYIFNKSLSSNEHKVNEDDYRNYVVLPAEVFTHIIPYLFREPLNKIADTICYINKGVSNVNEYGPVAPVDKSEDDLLLLC